MTNISRFERIFEGAICTERRIYHAVSGVRTNGGNLVNKQLPSSLHRPDPPHLFPKAEESLWISKLQRLELRSGEVNLEYNLIEIEVVVKKKKKKEEANKKVVVRFYSKLSSYFLLNLSFQFGILSFLPAMIHIRNKHRQRYEIYNFERAINSN